jgi:hypothetical protein
MAEVLRDSYLLDPEEAARTLDELRQFDPAIDQRVDSINMGLFPNGHNPDGVLSAAMKGTDTETFIEEYRWAMAVGAFPHREHGDKSTLLETEQQALFKAGETYLPEHEPNFLKHFSRISGQLLKEAFGVTTKPAVQPHEFDRLVIDEHLRPLPPLADQRSLDIFQAKDAVFHVLVDRRLVHATVKNAEPYSHAMTLNPVRPSQAIFDRWQQQLEAITEQMEVFNTQNHKNSQPMTWDSLLTSPVPDKLRLERKNAGSPGDNIEESDFVILALNQIPGARGSLKLRPGVTTPNAEVLYMLGYISHPEYPLLVERTCPGLVHFNIHGVGIKSQELVTDADHNYIIPEGAWQPLKKDPLYREEWLDHGSVESVRERDTLRKAIVETN